MCKNYALSLRRFYTLKVLLSMRKVIVFKVENVLVNGYDERKSDELNAKRVVRELVGDEFFEREFVKGEKKMMKEKDGDVVEKVVRKIDGFGLMKKRLEEFERSYEKERDVEKLFWMRDVLRKLEEWEERKDERMDGMRRKYVDQSFGKRVIGIKDDLRILERICGVTGGRMIFVSEMKRNKVVGLLMSNGLKEFEVRGDMDFLKGVDEKEVVVFDSVESLGNMWGLIGLKRV